MQYAVINFIPPNVLDQFSIFARRVLTQCENINTYYADKSMLIQFSNRINHDRANNS